jgi:hypothetical protein
LLDAPSEVMEKKELLTDASAALVSVSSLASSSLTSWFAADVRSDRQGRRKQAMIMMLVMVVVMMTMIMMMLCLPYDDENDDENNNM